MSRGSIKPQEVTHKMRPLLETWKLKGRRTRGRRRDQEGRREAGVWGNGRRGSRRSINCSGVREGRVQSPRLLPGQAGEGLRRALCVSKREVTMMSILGAWGDPRLKTGEEEGTGREAERKKRMKAGREPGSGPRAQLEQGGASQGKWLLPGEDTQHRWR